MTAPLFRLWPCLAALLTLGLPVLTHAATLSVPSAAYPTIQSGVDASHDGDIVQVADGTYSGPGNRDVDFHGKNIGVTSQNGPATTIIDCGGYASTDGSGNHRGFYLHSGEINASINGFTIKNGYEHHVLSIPDSDQGGGICIDNTTGGKITLINCVITNNTARTLGSGTPNSSHHGTTTLTNSTTTRILPPVGNSGEGGGVFNANSNGTTVLINCAISGNYVGNGGGGVYSSIGTTTLANCTISANIAFLGGGIDNPNGTTTLTNCTISANTAFANLTSGGGGGIYNGNGTLTLTNNIIYGNTGGEVSYYKGVAPTASFSDIQGGYPGTNNIDADPLFVNASAGDLHLNLGSPCIGKGTPNGAPATDLDGNPRANPPSIGAYESGSGGVSEDPSKLHLLADGINGDAAGIVCDNLSGMDDATKDKLTLSLPDFPDATNLMGTVTAPGPNTNDTGEVRTAGTATCYFPPDEYNDNQVPQDVTKDITKSATRTVTLTLHFTSGGKQHVIAKSIILARPPVVLVHGINSNPSSWNPLVQGVTFAQNLGGLDIDTPFVAVNHNDPSDYIQGLQNGNGPVEIGAQLLSDLIKRTLNSVKSGVYISDENENQYSQDSSKNEVHSYYGYVSHPLAIKRVDLVAWSYGGLVTRWYIASTGTKPASDWPWYKRDFPYPLFLPQNTKYGSDIRKVITLGSMWRGVPLANYGEEALSSQNDPNGLFHAPFAPFNSLGDFIIGPLTFFLNASYPSVEVMGVDSKWLNYMIYGNNAPTPHPFNNAIAYGSIAGDDSRYLPGNDFFFTNPYTNIDKVQTPSWFPYLRMEYLTSPNDYFNGAQRNYSDGVVPLWSSQLPGSGSSKIVNVIHSDYPSNSETQKQVVLWLNSAALPQGKLLNGLWSDPNNSQIQSFDGTKTWDFVPAKMAPYPQSDLYKDGRINPQALGGPGRTYPSGNAPGVVKPHLFAVLARNGANTVVNVFVLNSGSVLIPDVQITGVTIQAGPVITLNPNVYKLGTLPVGGSAKTSVPFTGFLGTSGTSVIVKVTYTYALSNGTAPLAFRAQLP